MSRALALAGAVAGLLRRLRGDAAVVVALLGVVAVAAFVFAAAPRQLNRVADRALREALAEGEAIERGLEIARADRPEAGPPGRPLATVAREGERVAAALPAAVRELQGPPTSVLDSPRYLMDQRDGEFAAVRYLTLRLQDGIDEQLTLVEGRLPERGDQVVEAGSGVFVQAVPLLEVALSTRTAEQLGVGPGDRLNGFPDASSALVAGAPANLQVPLAVEITGLVTLTPVAAPYWFGDERLHRADERLLPEARQVYAFGIAAPDALPEVLSATAPLPLGVTWRYPFVTERLNAGNAAALVAEVTRLEAQNRSAATLSSEPTVRTGLPSLFARLSAQRRVAEAALAVAGIGLFAVVLVTVGLVAALSAQRRRGTLALLRSRGASAGQLLCAEAAEALLVAGPAGVVGYAGAVVLVPARGSLLSWALCAVLVTGAAALLVAFAIPLVRAEVPTDGREETSAWQRSPRRALLEALVIGLAAAGVVLLRQRGLSAAAAGAAGFDPYLAAVPVLLGGATALAVVRLYPLPVGLAARVLARGRGLVGALGLRRVARQPTATALPLLALLLATTVAVFASVVVTSVGAGQQRASWESVGAAYRVDVPPSAAAALQGVVARPEVELAARAFLTADVEVAVGERSRRGVTLLAVDVERYAEVVAATPLDDLPLAELALDDPPLADLALDDVSGDSGALPAVVASALAVEGESLSLRLQGVEVPLRARGAQAGWPAVEADRPFVVVSLDALNARLDDPLLATRLYLRGAAGAEAALTQALAGVVARADGGAEVRSQAGSAEQVRDAPLAAGTVSGFRLGAALATVYAVLAVVAGLALSLRARVRDLSYLRTLGLSDRQSFALAAVELAPPLAVALAAGVALGAGVAALVGPGLDLSPFTGADGPAALTLDARSVLAVAGALGATVTAAVAAVGFTARHLDLGRALRVGDR